MSITPVQFRTGDIQTGSPTALQNLNTFMRQVAQTATGQVAAPSWVDVITYVNGWGPFSRRHVQYAQLPDTRVIFNGLIAGGTIGLPAFTLPRDLWPGQNKHFAVSSNAAFGEVTIRAADGTVVPGVGNNTFVSLDGISFYPGS